jgi:hypothetical protein
VPGHAHAHFLNLAVPGHAHAHFLNLAVPGHAKATSSTSPGAMQSEDIGGQPGPRLALARAGSRVHAQLLARGDPSGPHGSLITPPGEDEREKRCFREISLPRAKISESRAEWLCGMSWPGARGGRGGAGRGRAPGSGHGDRPGPLPDRPLEPAATTRCGDRPRRRGRPYPGTVHGARWQRA